MAKYDFSCKNCGTVEEKIVKIAEFDEPQKCEQCAGLMDRVSNYNHIGVVWACSGSTRGFGGGKNTPKTPGINPGHQPPTLNSLGLSEEQGKTLGIK